MGRPCLYAGPVRSAQRAVQAAFLFLLVPILILAGLAPATGAQDTAVAARLSIVSIPPSHGPDDDLNLRVRVVNEGEETLDGFRLTLGAGGNIGTRSELESSFENPPLLTSFTLDYPNRKIPPGEGRTVEVDPPVTDLVTPTEGGVHPLSLSLLSAENALSPLSALTTQIMVYPSEPLAPLNLVTVLPLSETPARDPEGFFVDDGSGQSWLESATTEGGWLDAIAAALETATAAPQGNADGGPSEPPLQIGFAPTPRLVEELAAMSDGFVRAGDEGAELEEDSPAAEAAREVLNTLREIAGRPSVQPLLVPYSYPDLPSLEEEMSPGDVAVQLTEAITVLGEHLGIELDRGWVFPPAGRLDDSSLQALQAAGVDGGVLFAPDALEGSDDPGTSGCPVVELSFVCPIRVETDVGPIQGYVADEGLQSRLGDLTEPGAGALEIQRVLAETAMIHAEQPGTPDRILQATIFAGWHPSRTAARALLTGLREAPWLHTATPIEGLELAEPVARRVEADSPSPPGLPDDAYFQGIDRAKDVVQSFSTFIGEQGPRAMLQRLRRNILVAEGRSLWDANNVSVAESYASRSFEEATGEMEKVVLGVPPETTFTSRTGTLDVSLISRTEYPVEVKVVLRALDMNFDPATFEDRLEPGTNKRRSIGAEAQTSGTFPIEVRVETADGYTIASEAIQVTSTEFNVVALAITFGAVAFLILFYVIKGMRRRARHETAEIASD